MLGKKKKRVLAAMMCMMILVCIGVPVNAASYVSGSLGGKTCTGVLKYDTSTKSFIATTTCPDLEGDGVYFRTAVSGEFSRYGVSLGTKEGSNNSGYVKITNSNATGYILGNGFHEAFWSNKQWAGGTNI